MVRFRPRILVSSLALGLAGLGLAGPGATAAGDNQWATVNICDTASNPDAIGIRARAPGNGTTQNIWMRFFVQKHTSTGAWVQADNRISPWVKLGSANFTWREAGRTFFFPNVPAGATLKLRGRVKIEYRKNGNVIHSATEITEGNHHAAGGGDPPHYSAATCTITG
jgi:hypothetical protein